MNDKFSKISDEQTGDNAQTGQKMQKKFNVSEYIRCLPARDRWNRDKCMTCVCMWFFIAAFAAMFCVTGIFLAYFANNIRTGVDSKCDRYPFCDYVMLSNDTCAITYIGDDNTVNECDYLLDDAFTIADCIRISDECIQPRGHRSDCPITRCNYDFSNDITTIVGLCCIMTGILCICVFVICQSIKLLRV